MKKYLLATVLFLAGIIAPILVIHASTDFALVAISPTSRWSVCARQPTSNILETLKTHDFQPKQDDTGFIYSLIGYDGPLSSDPQAQQAFWEFWVKKADGQLTFSNFGPSQTQPEQGALYLFHFGNGQTPTTDVSYSSVCQKEEIPAAPVSPEPLLPAQSTPTASPPTNPSQNSPAEINDALIYLRNNHATQSISSKDWAAMALGSHSQGIGVDSNDSEAVLGLSRNVLARAAQNLDRTAQLNKIKASYSNNQFGDSTLINDDIFSILAIQSTDAAWLKDHQGVFETIIASQRASGSFGYSSVGDGDVDMTAAAIWALVYRATYPSESINKALTYLATAQNSNGGFGFQPNAAPNIASSSWAMLAYTATGRDSNVIKNYLTSQKQSGGYWLFGDQPNYLNTAYAVLALSGKKLPIVGLVKTTQPAPSIKSMKSPMTLPRPIERRERQIKIEQSFAEATTGSCSASASASASASGTYATASASASASCN